MLRLFYLSTVAALALVFVLPVARAAAPIALDAKGSVVSANPVWNACIRGLPLTAEFMKTNPDKILHRQGKTRIFKPKSCRDYHRGHLKIWSYPDAPIQLVLDGRGRLLGDAPPGYWLQKK